VARRQKHGHGTFTWVNGDSYAGAWRNGKKHGHGTHAWADGSSYEGAWHEDAIHQELKIPPHTMF